MSNYFARAARFAAFVLAFGLAPVSAADKISGAAPLATPSISIADVTTTEGNSGWHEVNFTLTLSAPSSSDVTFYFATSEVSAVGNEDFQHAYSSLWSIPAGQASLNLVFYVWGDDVVEPTETFKVDLINVTGATVAKSTGIGTIVNDDSGAAATLTIADQQITEGNSGSKTATFTVQLSKAASSAVSFNIATANGTATAGTDYTALNLTGQSIAAGQTSKTFSVTIAGDTAVENEETFTVNLSNASGAAITRGTALGTIINDDSVNPVKIYVGDYYITEGNSGTQVVNFPVQLSQASASPVTFDIRTENGSATAPSDFVAKTLTGQSIAAGQTLKNFSVTVNGDTLPELEEHFVVTLSNVAGAAIWYGDTHGVGQIKNDDATISIGDASLVEGDYGDTDMVFPVTLSAPLDSAMMFRYQTCDGTAKTADGDYWGAGGPYYTQIGSGQTTTNLRIQIAGDIKVEADETFCLDLIDVQGAALGDTHAVGTILNDDLPPPTASVGNASQLEGDGGQYPYLNFPLTFSHALQTTVTVHYHTTNTGTATAGVDYGASSGTSFQINPGTSQVMLSVPVYGDYDQEPNETVGIVVDSIDGGVVLQTSTATGTILNDDDGTPQPELSVSDASAPEGQPAVFTVSLSSAYSKPVEFDLSLVSHTAQWGDFDSTTYHHTIPAGQTSIQVSVPTVADGEVEGDEQFRAEIANLLGAVLADGYAMGTIVDDDILNAPVLSIADVSINEGNSGTRTLNFVVQLSKPSTQEVAIWPNLQDVTTTSGVDYVTPQSQLFVSIPAGQTSANLSVTIKGDVAPEANERMQLNVGSNYGVIVNDYDAIGTIVDDDSANAPTLSIADLRITEGDNGTKNARFTATLGNVSQYDVSFLVSVADGSAIAYQDYYPFYPYIVTIPAGTTSATIDVSLIGDSATEADETFTITLSDVAGAKAGDFQAVGTIANDDIYPAVSIGADQSITEGNSGTKLMLFTVSLAEPANHDVSFWATPSPGTASYDDFSGGGETIIPAGQTSITVGVGIIGDTTPESDETFSFSLSGIYGGVAGNRIVATGTILNDDGDPPPPSLSIYAPPGYEGNVGQQNFPVYVTLSSAYPQPVTVNYATSNGTATAGADYVATSGTLTLPAGWTQGQIYVPVNGDMEVEDHEDFVVTLSNPSAPITIATATAIVGIYNDDTAPPTITMGDVSVYESGIRASVPVVLSHSMPTDLWVDAAVTPGSATAGADYTLPNQTRFMIPAGYSTWWIEVGLINDSVEEANETFTVTISNASNGEILDAQGTATIVDDDGAMLSIGDASVVEGNSGTKTANFTVSLSKAAPTAVTFDAATADGNATTGSDFVALALTGVSLAAGETSKTLSVTINGDTTVETDEYFQLNLGNVAGATVADGSALGAIVNDDVAELPAISVNDASIVEDCCGIHTGVQFAITLSKPSPVDITVNVVTTGVTATADVDFFPDNRTLTIPAGTTTSSYYIGVAHDSTVEADETFTLNLSSPVNATLADGQGVGTIVDNDVSISIGDVSISEGNSGTKNAEFVVSISEPTGAGVSFDVATANGTATAGSDYSAVSFTGLFIDPGQTSRTISVPITGDTTAESDEAFTVSLANVFNATVADGSATGTITNDDVASGPTLSIGDVSIAEGNSGTKTASFTVTLSAAQSNPVFFDAASADGTATAGSDYVAKALTGQRIAIGSTSKTFTVIINGDTTAESDETFVVNLSNPVGATVADGVGLGTITNDDGNSQPVLSIGNVSVAEGNSGTSPALVTVSLSAPAPAPVSFDIETYPNGEGADPGNDFVWKSASLVIPAGSTSTTFSVDIVGDVVAEPTEAFGVNVTNVTGASVPKSFATITITDSDTFQPPEITVSSALFTEGDSGTKTIGFTVSLSAAVALPVGFDIATGNGSATAGSDYVALSLAGQVIEAGQTSKTFSVTINGDTDVESDEYFTVDLSNVSNAVEGLFHGTGQIMSDDAVTPPVLSLDFTGGGNEGNPPAGGMELLTVRLSKASAFPVTFDLSTADGTAIAGSDYVAMSQSGSIAAGQLSATYPIQFVADTTSEPNETFSVNVSNVSGASVGNATMAVTIVNDDAAATPTLSIGDVSISEGNAGNKNATFTVSLSAPPTSTVCYHLETANGTAIGGTDFVSSGWTGCTPANQTTTTYDVPIIGDTDVEPNESFTISVSDVTGATVLDGTATGTITNDDSAGGPTLSIGDVTIAEGNSGTKTATFTVTLSAAQSSPVFFDAATANGTATSGSDYVAKTTAGIRIPAGATTKTFVVTINGDTAQEADETFVVNLSNPVGATIADGQATGTITNDDAAATPTLSIADASVSEGNSGTKTLTFTVSLSPAAAGTVTYNIATANGTATSGSDYVASSLTGQTISAGATSKTFAVTLNGDTTTEANETFTVTLSSVSGATLGDGVATGTITNDDGGSTPTISISDATVVEGNSLSKQATFTVTLSAPATSAVTYNIATANGTAVAPGDYTAKSLTGQSIAAGATSKTFTVSVKGETLVEPNETFVVNLSSVVGAAVADGQGTGTITNDDGAAISVARFDARGLVDDIDDGNRAPLLSRDEYALLLLDTTQSLCRRTDGATVVAVEGVENRNVLAELADAANASCAGKPVYTAVMADGDGRGFLVESKTQVQGAPELLTAANATALRVLARGQSPTTVLLAGPATGRSQSVLAQRVAKGRDESLVLLGATAQAGLTDLSLRARPSAATPPPADRILVNSTLLREFGDANVRFPVLPVTEAPAQVLELR